MTTAATASTDLAPARSKHRPDIQGLRAVAVLAVLAYHAGLPLPGGFTGVDMFFVISGFVITGSLISSREATTGRSLVAFYKRRVRRLLPALALTITVVAIASMAFVSPVGLQRTTAETGVHATLISANFYLQGTPNGYFDLVAEANPLLHTWSLSVEEQFYLVFPALLLMVGALVTRSDTGRSRRALTVLVAALVAVSFAMSYRTSVAPSFGVELPAFFSPVARAWEFGVGALLALGAPALMRCSRRWSFVLGAAGAGLLVVGFVTIDRTTVFPGLAALLPVIGTALLVAAGLDAGSGTRSWLSFRPAVWVGDVSYGLYLWHWPFIVFASAMVPRTWWVPVLAAVASFIPTTLSYRFVENPIRFHEPFTRTRFAGVAAICLVVPIVACFALVRVSTSESETPAVQRIADTARVDGDAWRSCTTPLADREPSSCRASVEHPAGEVVLVGDSNAGHFRRPVMEAANDAGYDATLAIRTGCPFVDLERSGDGFEDPGCHAFVDRTMAFLEQDPPSLLVIAMASTQVINDASSLTDPQTGVIATSAEDKAELWEVGVRSILQRAERAGIPVLFVHTVGHLAEHASDWFIEECPAVRIYLGACGITVPRSEIEARQVLAREAEERAVAQVEGVIAADFTSDLCGPDACSAERSGVWIYRDAAHLSADGSELLTERFERLIVEAAAPRTLNDP